MSRKKTQAPERKDGLIVQSLGDEVIVYDRVTHRAHSLNHTAALVFDNLDGVKDLDGVARQVGKSLGKGPQKELVASAVNDLAEADLLRPGASLPRRAALRGLAATFVPLVVSITVPAAAAAASCLPSGESCSLNEDCCSGNCCSGNFCSSDCTPP